MIDMREIQGRISSIILVECSYLVKLLTVFVFLVKLGR